MGTVRNPNRSFEDVRRHRLARAFGAAALLAGVAACGSDVADSDADASSDSAGAAADRPEIVVTTNILGDVVAAAVGDLADVEVIMPLGTDPHDFAPSARQAEAMENADLLIVNGANFEEGMLDIIANVADSGTEVFSFADQIDLLEFDGEHGHEEHSDEDHDEGEEHSDEDHDEDGEHSDEDHDEGEEHSDEDHDEHGHEDGDDPHIWTDPTRIATAVAALESEIAALPGVDADALSASFGAYLDELTALDASMEASLEAIAESDRVLVTNHAVFSYFADRYDFEVVGAIIPSLSTNAEPSASDIDELAELIEAEGISAIFGETTQSSALPDALADEVGGTVQVVELFSESLGEEGSGAETYTEMMQSNADLIAAALSS